MNKNMGKSLLLLMSGFLVMGSSPLYANAKEEKETNKSESSEKLVVTDALLSKNKGIKKKQVELLNLNKEVQKLEKEIKKLDKELEREKVLDKKKEELNEMKEQLNILIEQYGERINTIQTQGDSENRLFEVLFNSKDLGDMISKSMAFKSIAEADEDMVDDIKRDSEFLEIETKKLQIEMDKLNKKKEEALSKKKELNKNKKLIEKELKKMKKSERERLELEFKKQLERKKRMEEKLKEQEALEKALKEQEKELSRQSSELEENSQRAFDALRQLTKEGNDENGEYFIQPTTGILTQHAGEADGSNGYLIHTGMDIANPSKPPVMASMKGEVVRAVHGGTGYGNYIKLKHQVGNTVYYTLYGHLDFIGVNEGEMVEQGEMIGIMGTTGNSTGVHLHFEILDENGKWMDPETFYTFNDPDVIKLLKKSESKKEDKDKEKKEKKKHGKKIITVKINKTEKAKK